jgi:RNA polymerase sigma factor (sigma-70 family)
LNSKTTYSEDQLVAMLQKREQKAYGYLYENYSAALFGIINAIVPDKETASDGLQNVFVNIWKKIDSYDNRKGRLFTWMLNIARNAAIDEVRSKSHRESLQNQSLAPGGEIENVSTVPVIEDVGLKKILSRLKEEWRILVDLSYFQGFTHEEISKLLNIPLGTVKTRLRTALMQLRSMMK